MKKFGLMILVLLTLLCTVSLAALAKGPGPDYRRMNDRDRFHLTPMQRHQLLEIRHDWERSPRLRSDSRPMLDRVNRVLTPVQREYFQRHLAAHYSAPKDPRHRWHGYHSRPDRGDDSLGKAIIAVLLLMSLD